jgi:hypothetical protein
MYMYRINREIKKGEEDGYWEGLRGEGWRSNAPPDPP